MTGNKQRWHRTKAARKNAGLTGRQAYEALGITCTQLARIERGETLDKDIALKMCELYNVSMTDLGVVEKLSKSQQDIVNEMSNLQDNLLVLAQPFAISRRESYLQKWDIDAPLFTYWVHGYARAAMGLVQRGILIRDSTDIRFWLTEYGIEYIKGLQS